MFIQYFHYLVFLMFIISYITLMMLFSVVGGIAQVTLEVLETLFIKWNIATFNCCVIFTFDLREWIFVILDPVECKYHVYTIV